MNIIFLGTGGSWPTVKRNVASVALKRGSEIILFDCGEGTQRQFQKSKLSYMQISKIFITHFHGDHFLGLPGLIQTMQLNDREKPLHLYGPIGLEKLVYQLLSLGYFKPAYRIVSHEVSDKTVLDFDSYKISAMRVNHNVPALAYSIEEAERIGKFNKPKALELGVPEGPLFSKLQRGKAVTLDNGKKITSDMVEIAKRILENLAHDVDHAIQIRLSSPQFNEEVKMNIGFSPSWSSIIRFINQLDNDELTKHVDEFFEAFIQAGDAIRE